MAVTNGDVNPTLSGTVGLGLGKYIHIETNQAAGTLGYL